MRCCAWYTFPIILGIISALLGYMGVFNPVTFKDETIGPFYTVLKAHKGAFHKIGAVCEAADAAAKEAGGTPSADCFSIYFSDPGTVPEEELSSLCGSSYSKEEYDAMKSLKYDAFRRTFPQTKCRCALFPYRNDFSYMIGAMKVYPKMATFMDEIKGAPMELTSLTHIKYCAPLENGESFQE